MSRPPELRAQVAAYRRAAAELRESHSAQAQARAEYDRAADELADARTAAAAAAATLPREQAAAEVRARTAAQVAAERATRDRLRTADADLERARIAERLEREVLTALRAILLPAEDGGL